MNLILISFIILFIILVKFLLKTKEKFNNFLLLDYLKNTQKYNNLNTFDNLLNKYNYLKNKYSLNLCELKNTEYNKNLAISSQNYFFINPILCLLNNKNKLNQDLLIILSIFCYNCYNNKINIKIQNNKIFIQEDFEYKINNFKDYYPVYNNTNLKSYDYKEFSQLCNKYIEILLKIKKMMNINCNEDNCLLF